jgi:hypothetical protein
MIPFILVGGHLSVEHRLLHLPSDFVSKPKMEATHASETRYHKIKDYNVKQIRLL